jgi:hypothetical protein
MCPSSKKSSDGEERGIHPALEEFSSIGQVVEPLENEHLKDYKPGDPVRVFLYRIEPKTYSGGGPEILEEFPGAPTLREIQGKFGGGRYLLRPRVKGRFTTGSVEFAINGAPKYPADDQELEVSESSLSRAARASGDTTGLVVAMFNDLKKELREELSAVSRKSADGFSGFDAEALSRFIDVANRKKFETQILGSIFDTEAKKPAAGFSLELVAPLLETALMLFQAGAKMKGGEARTEGSSDLLERILEVLPQILGQRAPVPPGAGAPVPRERALERPVPDVESRRVEVEQNGVLRKAQLIEEQLKRGVWALVECLEAEVDYSVDQVVEMVRDQVQADVLELVRDKLTFENVRALMKGEPSAQIALDENRERVGQVLLALVNGAGPGSGNSQTGAGTDGS